MDRTRKEEREREALHPAAARAAASAGRVHPERPDPWRTVFERDRDRVVHCSAFRRLEYKTQVFLNHIDDNHRTRLTHSLEVHQVARSLALALDLNEHLVEAVALAHDVGHPPFGHTGEALLNRRAEAVGGFAHNRQALRVVELLERRSPEYPGLNLTAEVRQSLCKHESLHDPATGERLRHPLLEAQVVDLADSTAYHYHDVEDGLRAGLLDPGDMLRELPLWARAVEEVQRRHPGFRERELLFWRRAANEMLGMTIVDIQEESLGRLGPGGPRSAAAAQRWQDRCIAHSAGFREEVAGLHRYLYENLYILDEVKRHIRRATGLLDRLFGVLLERPGAIPPEFRAGGDPLERTICDFLASMTDRGVERMAGEFGLVPA